MNNKIFKILGYVAKGMNFFVTTVVAMVSLATAYIVFAPDNLPKPFRLVYDYTNVAPMPAPVGENVPVVEPTEEVHQLKPGDGVMFNMSTKIINLADPSGRKYIRLTMVLEFAPDDLEYEKMPEEEKSAYLTGFEEKIMGLMPMMDDTVITLLSTKTYEQLYTADGKEQLRQEIMQAIASRVTEYQILSVYFTEFVVQ